MDASATQSANRWRSHRLIRAFVDSQATRPAGVQCARWNACFDVECLNDDLSGDQRRHVGVLDHGPPQERREVRALGSERPVAWCAVLLPQRSEEHTSELQSLTNLVCRLLLE